MDDFNAAFAFADTAAFARMAKPGKGILFNVSAAAGSEIDVIEMPSEESAEYRAGGKVRSVSIEFEVVRTAFEAAGAKESGWKLRVGEVDFRIVAVRPQGGTLTLVCGPLADATSDAW